MCVLVDIMHIGDGNEAGSTTWDLGCDTALESDWETA